MAVLIYTESENGKLKKNAFETASFGYAVAQQLGVEAIAVSFHTEESSSLGAYGISKVYTIKQDSFKVFNAKTYSNALSQVAEKIGATAIIVSSSADTKYMAPLLAAKLKAGYVPNVIAAPESSNPFTVKRTVFSNKGFAHTQITTRIKLIGVSNNAFGVIENKVSITTEDFTVTQGDRDTAVRSTKIDRVVDKATIADADIVVSAGRGLKGPENWGMIEELADVLNAATACSKPVSDLGWRPHGEHVGQTGKPVASNLYIAIGISGAIQHLAGVSASKTKVVINTDPDAPFFKAADYGIVGDAFDVVPELIEKLRDFKAQNA